MDDDGQPQTMKVVSGRLLLLLIAYVIAIICLGFGVSDRFCLLVCWKELKSTEIRVRFVLFYAHCLIHFS